MVKTWFITGSSRGFGRIWAEAAFARGDKVAATARDKRSLSSLAERFGHALLPLRLDVTQPDQAQRAVRTAHEHFGRLDVVVNNAGYSLVGTLEEANVADVRIVQNELFRHASCDQGGPAAAARTGPRA